MKKWIQLRKKQISFICGILFVELLPLFDPEFWVFAAKGEWGIYKTYTMGILIVAAMLAMLHNLSNKRP